MELAMAVGTSDFRKLREQGRYFVDKSFFISRLLARTAEVVLLPRPRRFGKTLNLSMLHCFFDQAQESRALFEGLAITDDPIAMAKLNAYPTIFLSFTGIDFLDWDSCLEGLKERIGSLIGNFLATLQDAANPFQREVLENLFFRRASATQTASSLSLMIELLAKAAGKKVIVLIDEYDKLIIDGKARGYFPEITSFMRNFLGSALKDQPFLERAVITGILRISKESIYSGLNNLVVFSLRDSEFSNCFGFTEAEVHKILSDTDLLEKEASVRAWYNGYTFGEGTTIYNPWSILRFVSQATKRLRPFWINTSDNQIIRDLIQNQAVMSLEELEILLSGGTVAKELLEDIAFAEMKPDTAWSLMFFTGYLTARNANPDEPAELAIPNLEVKRFFSQTVASWLGGETAVRNLADHLLAENFQGFATSLADVVSSILSYHDMGGKQPERVYQVFLLGLLAHLQNRYTVVSERQTGHGRADLCLIPHKPGQTGFIFEFKASTSQKSLETDAQKALNQINERDYRASQRQAGVQRVAAIGLAFHSKRFALAIQTYEGADLASNLKTFSSGLVLQQPRRTTRVNPAGRELCDPNATPTPETLNAQAQEKLILIGQIQLLQKLKGLPVMSLEQLKSADLAVLTFMVESLQN